jgi:hypothetical protein
MKNENTTHQPGADSESKNLLKFTCPECGSHRLEEVVLMRQEIEGVYDPEDPNYEWYYDLDRMVVVTRTVYAVPSDGNFYRCYDCEIPLTDEDGGEFWEAEYLYEWLLSHPESEDDFDEQEGSESEQG